MARIEIDVATDGLRFILRGSTLDLMDNRRAASYLRSYLAAMQTEDGSILIPYSPEDREGILSKIRGVLARFGIEEARSVRIEDALHHYYEEEANFTVFTQKAKEIWENKVDTKEFQLFIEALKERVTGRTLYDLQVLSAFHLAFSQNACNFSVPGAGKTSVVYGAYAYLNSLGAQNSKFVNKILVIGPLSSFGPWENEFRACFGRNPISRRLSGGITKEEREHYFYSGSEDVENAELILMSYQAASSNLEDLKHYLQRSQNRVMVVLDEAHRIKNTEGGVWAESVLELASFCRSRVVLTGTPAPNGYEDLYNLFKFIWPKRNVAGFNLYHLRDMSATRNDPRIKELIDNVSPFFVRVTKQDLRIPPPVEHEPVMVNMDSTQRRIYDYLEQRYVDYFQSQLRSGSLKDALCKARLVRLMQTASNPALLQKPIDEFTALAEYSETLFIDDPDILEQIRNYQVTETPAKFKRALALVKEIISSGGKAVVWANYIFNLYGLQDYFRANGVDSKILYGGTPTDSDTETDEIETREIIINQFHEQDSPFRVIIANPYAVGESISLHKACKNAIYLERNFNAATFLQSKDRIHRYGLQRNDVVNYYYILTRYSIDETVHQRLLEKEDAMRTIIESRTIPLLNLNMDYEEDSEDDIKALLRDYVGRHARSG